MATETTLTLIPKQVERALTFEIATLLETLGFPLVRSRGNNPWNTPTSSGFGVLPSGEALDGGGCSLVNIGFRVAMRQAKKWPAKLVAAEVTRARTLLTRLGYACEAMHRRKSWESEAVPSDDHFRVRGKPPRELAVAYTAVAMTTAALDRETSYGTPYHYHHELAKIVDNGSRHLTPSLQAAIIDAYQPYVAEQARLTDLMTAAKLAALDAEGTLVTQLRARIVKEGVSLLA